MEFSESWGFTARSSDIFANRECLVWEGLPWCPYVTVNVPKNVLMKFKSLLYCYE